ncbi:Hypothetical predicted protein [Octopus vulgaris]|uniref:Uncharacterized protein n=1 Tax=Octopus vulgaris TaxID=6645 RepID=A0AA36BDT8_OCTVU|nr:Hypothetical predicted protein [Octopus vulgaris]
MAWTNEGQNLCKTCLWVFDIFTAGASRVMFTACSDASSYEPVAYRLLHTFKVRSPFDINALSKGYPPITDIISVSFQ